jgi:predicted transcriptional regulator
VTSDKRKFAFVFHPAVTREEVMHHRMLDLADELCAGETVPLVMAFAQQHRFTDAEIQQFRQMIDELEAKRRRRTTR